ncbi:hypothetical protein [Desulfopila sp. IMCC35008]|nr:hypothetical protein [Desulfopila sp. IMCC35008]
MTKEQAIRILMESPVYFTLAPAERKQLIDEYRENFSTTGQSEKEGQKQ